MSWDISLNDLSSKKRKRIKNISNVFFPNVRALFIYPSFLFFFFFFLFSSHFNFHRRLLYPPFLLFFKKYITIYYLISLFNIILSRSVSQSEFRHGRYNVSPSVFLFLFSRRRLRGLDI